MVKIRKVFEFRADFSIPNSQLRSPFIKATKKLGAKLKNSISFFSLMADFNPPSFSLGLEFDFEPLNHNNPLSTPTHVNPVTVEPGEKELEDDVEFQLRVSDSEPESPKKLSRNRLRRLRRGGSSSSKPISTPIISFVDDDIEDFSDEENARLNHLQAQHHSRCSSSKLPLSGHGVLTRQQESVVNNKKVKHDSSCPSTSLGSSKGKRLFSDLSSSPLRRFQLLDSESDLDEPPDNVYIDKNPSGANCKDKQNDSSRGGHEVPLVKNIDSLPPNSQKQDLWKDFSFNENHSVKTPVFDECFEEYFKTSKPTKRAGDSHKSRSSEQGKSLHNANKQLQQDLGPVPPSHYYFYHDDLKIQELVRSRLPHFFLLSSASDARHQSHNASSIDYMDQFGQEGAKQRNGKQVASEKSAKKGRKRTKKSSVDDTLLDSGNWINPKQTANMPKDAGRRRVHAHGQSAGHWITAENGKKVYITKNGEELSGSLAYRHYRKESGKGFKKAKKKTTAKKK